MLNVADARHGRGSPAHRTDPFVRRLNASGEKWVIIVDRSGKPVLVLDADHLIRDAVFGQTPFDPQACCQRPVMVTDMNTPARQRARSAESEAGAVGR